MLRLDEIRGGEVAIDPLKATDAGLACIGRIHTPRTDRLVSRIAEHPAGRLGDLPPWNWPPLAALAQAA